MFFLCTLSMHPRHPCHKNGRKGENHEKVRTSHALCHLHRRLRAGATVLRGRHRSTTPCRGNSNGVLSSGHLSGMRQHIHQQPAPISIQNCHSRPRRSHRLQYCAETCLQVHCRQVGRGNKDKYRPFSRTKRESSNLPREKNNRSVVSMGRVS